MWQVDDLTFVLDEEEVAKVCLSMRIMSAYSAAFASHKIIRLWGSGEVGLAVTRALRRGWRCCACRAQSASGCA